MFVRSLLFLSFLSLAVCAFAGSIHNDPEFDAAVMHANELFLNAEFDKGIDTIRALEKGRSESPAVSYFTANGYWWKIFRVHIYDREAKETEFDQQFENYLQQTIDRSEKLLRRNKYDVPALFYLGNAYSLKSRVKGLRGSYFSAGRDAGKGKGYLEQALKLDPGLYDAYYNLGLYNYLAGTLPGYAKILKTLLFLPGGDKEKGLDYLKIASKKSVYFAAESRLLLARFYADFEDDPLAAFDVVKDFHAKYPNNAWYHFWLATLLADEINDYEKAEPMFVEILERCKRGDASYSGEVKNLTTLKLARVHSRQLYPERAIEEIKTLIASKPKEPTSILQRSYLELGTTYDLIGLRKDAITAYTQVLSLPDYRHSRRQAEELRSMNYNQTLATIYNLNLKGRRLTAEGKFDEADAAFQAILAKYPNNDQTLYHLAENRLMRGDTKKAEDQLKQLLRKNPKVPEWLVPGIYVRLGQVYEAGKLQGEAKRSYEKALETKSIINDDRNLSIRRLRQMSDGKS